MDEDLTDYQWSARVPSSHMKMILTFVVQSKDISKTLRNSAFESAYVTKTEFSQQLQDFVDQCEGLVSIRNDYTIHFSKTEDYTRFKLSDINENE